MNLKWHRSQASEVRIDCPFCNHQVVPPEYPYCPHTVFVYLEPSGGEPGFDFVRFDFAELYLARLKNSEIALKGNLDLSEQVQQEFLSGKLPPFHEQKIRLYEDVLRNLNFQVFDVSEIDSYYPTRVLAAFANSPLIEIDFDIPSCDEFNLGCALYKDKERRGFIYFEAANTIANNWGNPERMVDGVSRIISGWNRFYANFDRDDLADCINRNLGLLSGYRHRDISSLREEETDAIKQLFREFTDALKRKSDKRKSAVSTAKALSPLAPNFFPLWDSTIAWKYDCMYFSDSAEGQYLKFSWKMKKFFEVVSSCVNDEYKKDLLKIIDEYNYAKYTMGWI